MREKQYTTMAMRMRPAVGSSTGYIMRLRIVRLTSGSPVARSDHDLIAHSMAAMASAAAPMLNSTGPTARPRVMRASEKAVTIGHWLRSLGSATGGTASLWASSASASGSPSRKAREANPIAAELRANPMNRV